MRFWGGRRLRQRRSGLYRLGQRFMDGTVRCDMTPAIHGRLGSTEPLRGIGTRFAGYPLGEGGGNGTRLRQGSWWGFWAGTGSRAPYGVIDRAKACCTVLSRAPYSMGPIVQSNELSVPCRTGTSTARHGRTHWAGSPNAFGLVRVS